MTDRLTIAMAQINPTVGDIDGNVERILAAREKALGADLVVYSELVLCGYPPEDLVLKPFFQDKVEQAVGRLAEATADGDAALLIGAPWRNEGNFVAMKGKVRRCQPSPIRRAWKKVQVVTMPPSRK